MTDSRPSIRTLVDFPALQQLVQALWRRRGERGAAAMIGAGFSLNAEVMTQDARRPPLWRELAQAMATAIYGDSRLAPSDALRLAEEYRTYFGQAALDDMIRAAIPDAASRLVRKMRISAIPRIRIRCRPSDASSAAMMTAAAWHNVVSPKLSTDKRSH